MRRGALTDQDLASVRELRALLPRLRRGRATADEAGRIAELYRHACSSLARLEALGDDPRLAMELRRVVGTAHGLLFRAPRVGGPVRLVQAAGRLLLVDAPRTIRTEWRVLALSFGFLYGLALASFLAVRSDLDLASSLLNAAVVENEIRQLEETPAGEPFVGNFTFGLGESPHTAGWIMTHNMGVGLLFFAAALVPPLYLVLLTTNGLMLGTYTGVAAHWDQAGSISSILWCHGVLEIQALVLAGTAGLALVRALVRPGPWTRRHALRRESRTAWNILAPVFPMLFAAGLIEAFVSPHAPLAARLATAAGTGLLLVAWLGWSGRSARAE
jgi:uncharacterized membrane protein SpoIIM required for sporulation